MSIKCHRYVSFTVVANFSTYWVKLSSDAIQVEGAEPVSTDDGTAVTDAGVGNLSAPCLRESYSLYLIKSHGSLISNHHCHVILWLYNIQGALCVWRGGY